MVKRKEPRTGTGAGCLIAALSELYLASALPDVILLDAYDMPWIVRIFAVDFVKTLIHHPCIASQAHLFEDYTEIEEGSAELRAQELSLLVFGQGTV